MEGEEARPRTLVATPLEAIRTAKHLLYSAWFVHEAVWRGAITSETFIDELPEGDFRLRWPPENRTRSALESHAWNNVLAAMSITAIAADRALDETFSRPRPREREPLPDSATLSDLDATRTIMYMLRNAYAHEPLSPRWRLDERYRGVFCIKALAAFRRRREESLAFLRGLAPEQWDRSAIHPTRGRMTIDDFATL